jgi:hypothetical protein
MKKNCPFCLVNKDCEKCENDYITDKKFEHESIQRSVGMLCELCNEELGVGEPYGVFKISVDDDTEHFYHIHCSTGKFWLDDDGKLTCTDID